MSLSNHAPRAEVALGAFRLIAEGGALNVVELLGMNKSDVELTLGSEVWLGVDRQRIVSVLDALTHGTMDVIGLGRIDVPMEYRAAIIAVFVHPCNIQIACRWLETGVPADDILVGTSMDRASAAELFAFTLMILSEGQAARARWQKVISKSAAKLEVAK